MATTPPPVLIELTGKSPDRDMPLGFCATCCILYMGEISSDESVQAHAKEKVNNALEKGVQTVYIALPNSWRILRPAVTIAGSVRFPAPPFGPYVPMPVCWVHMQGAKPEDEDTGIIRGVNNHGG